MNREQPNDVKKRDISLYVFVFSAVPMIFPWFLGNAASPALAVIQFADLGGVQLVSGLLFAVDAALAGVVLSLAQRSALPWRFVGTTVLAVLLTTYAPSLTVGMLARFGIQ